jgi:RNA polymerase sigma-70 factor (ECF subfamily)
VDEVDDQGLASAAEEFEGHRGHLLGVAYRMLGTVADAEDAVQETYLRFAQVPFDEVHNVRGWLTTTLSRICLDELRSARARRESYVGPWLPEPLMRSATAVAGGRPGPDPADRVTLDESVSMALLVLLETLSPAERTALVLHDVMGLSYAEVSAVVGRSEAACRQLVSRARAHVRGGAPRFSADPAQHTSTVQAFLAACARGSVAELVRVLDPEVVLRSDGGGVVAGVARRPVVGADNVARLLLGVAGRNPASARFSTVNGSTGVVFEADGAVVGVMAFTVAAGRITEIDFVVNPDKLVRVPAAGAERQ